MKYELEGAALDVRVSGEIHWCVEERDTGLPVANGSAPSVFSAGREIQRYTMGGPTRYWIRKGRRTLVSGELAGLKTPNV